MEKSPLPRRRIVDLARIVLRLTRDCTRRIIYEGGIPGSMLCCRTNILQINRIILQMHHCWEISVCRQLPQGNIGHYPHTANLMCCCARPHGTIPCGYRRFWQWRSGQTWECSFPNLVLNPNPVWRTRSNEKVYHQAAIQVKIYVCCISLWWY